MSGTDALIRELERTRDETLGYFSLGDSDLARTYGPGKWSVRFLLHHLTDLSGHRQVTASLRNVGFDKKNIAAHRRPCETNDDARTSHALFDFFFETVFWSSQKLNDDVAVNQ